MANENIWFRKNDDESYSMDDLYLDHVRLFGYKDSYNYFYIDVKKILLSKKSYDEYIVRYYDVNKMKAVPLQLKIKNVFGDLHIFTNNDKIMFIYSNDKELFKNIEKYGIRLLN